MLLSDIGIKKAIEDGEITFDPFDLKCLNPASYDMRVGEEAFTSSGRTKLDLKAKGALVIEAGDFATVTTFESIKLSNIIAGHIGLRSYFTRKGLMPLKGPQIDPGFEGGLIIGLFNASPKDIIIPYKEPFCTLEFHRLNEPVEKPYDGPFQNQHSIPAHDIQNMIDAKGMSFGEVIRTIGALSSDVREMSLQVGNLSATVNNFKWLIGMGISIVAILAGIAIIFV